MSARSPFRRDVPTTTVSPSAIENVLSMMFWPDAAPAVLIGSAHQPLKIFGALRGTAAAQRGGLHLGTRQQPDVELLLRAPQRDLGLITLADRFVELPRVLEPHRVRQLRPIDSGHGHRLACISRIVNRMFSFPSVDIDRIDGYL